MGEMIRKGLEPAAQQLRPLQVAAPHIKQFIALVSSFPASVPPKNVQDKIQPLWTLEGILESTIVIVGHLRV